MNNENPSTPFNRGTGALRDPHDPNNYTHKEIFGVAKAPLWVEKSPEQWKRYGDVRDQYTSGSCVAQTIALLIGIENLREEGKFNHFSARPVYAKNFVAPDGGMYPFMGFKYGSEIGTPFEIQMRSQLIDEMSMRLINDEKPGDLMVAKIFRGGKYVEIIGANRVDAIASVTDRNKGVGISIRFEADLHPDKPILKLSGKYGHEITVTDYCLFNGVKGLVYQNSWGSSWGYKGLGFLPLAAFEAGCDSAFYFEDLLNSVPQGDGGVKPSFVFKTKMKVGSSGGEVPMLQKCLGYLKDAEGYLFPLVSTPTGYYGGVTRAAVKRFQAMNFIPQTGEVDSDTLIKLNIAFK